MCVVSKLLSTTVHVESRNRYCNERKTSPTPASPECVATRMCSIYFVLGGAFYKSHRSACNGLVILSSSSSVLRWSLGGGVVGIGTQFARTLILVAPLTDFSKEPDMVQVLVTLMFSGEVPRHEPGVNNKIKTKTLMAQVDDERKRAELWLDGRDEVGLGLAAMDLGWSDSQSMGWTGLGSMKPSGANQTCPRKI